MPKKDPSLTEFLDSESLSKSFEIIEKHWQSDFAIECDLGKIIVIFKQPETYGKTERAIEITARVEEFIKLSEEVDENYELYGLKFNSTQTAKEQLLDIYKTYQKEWKKYLNEANEQSNHLKKIQSYLLNLVEQTPYESDNDIVRAVKNLVYHQPLSSWKKSEIREAYSKYPDDNLLEELELFTSIPIKNDCSKSDLKIDFKNNDFKSMGCSIDALASYYGEANKVILKIISGSPATKTISDFNTEYATPVQSPKL